MMSESEILVLLSKLRAEYEIIKQLEKNEYDNHILDKVLDNHNNPTKWIDALEYLNNLEGKIEVINLILNPNEKENEINW